MQWTRDCLKVGEGARGGREASHPKKANASLFARLQRHAEKHGGGQMAYRKHRWHLFLVLCDTQEAT